MNLNFSLYTFIELPKIKKWPNPLSYSLTSLCSPLSPFPPERRTLLYSSSLYICSFFKDTPLLVLNFLPSTKMPQVEISDLLLNNCFIDYPTKALPIVRSGLGYLDHHNPQGTKFIFRPSDFMLNDEYLKTILEGSGFKRFKDCYSRKSNSDSSLLA